MFLEDAPGALDNVVDEVLPQIQPFFNKRVGACVCVVDKS